MRRPVLRLAHGYFGTTLDEILRRKRFTSAEEIAETLPAHRRRDSQPGWIATLVTTHPEKYFAPMRGVICSAEPGRQPTWLDVVAWRYPFDANVLRSLSEIQGTTLPALMLAVSILDSRGLNKPMLQKALQRLRVLKLVHRKNRSGWARSRAAMRPIELPAHIERAQHHIRARMFS